MARFFSTLFFSLLFYFVSAHLKYRKVDYSFSRQFRDRRVKFSRHLTRVSGLISSTHFYNWKDVGLFKIITVQAKYITFLLL